MTSNMLDAMTFLMNHGWKKVSTSVWIDPDTGKKFFSAQEAARTLLSKIEGSTKDHIRGID